MAYLTTIVALIITSLGLGAVALVVIAAAATRLTNLVCELRREELSRKDKKP